LGLPVTGRINVEQFHKRDELDKIFTFAESKFSSGAVDGELGVGWEMKRLISMNAGELTGA